MSEQNAINASVEKYRQETGPQFSRNEKLRRQLNHNISSGRESLLSEESVQYSMRGGIYIQQKDVSKLKALIHR